MIAKCNCKHTFQDQRYGKGKRVFNRSGAKGKDNEYRCTVCGLTQTFGQTRAAILYEKTKEKEDKESKKKASKEKK